MDIFDKNGEKQSLEWLRQEFGDVRVAGIGKWRVTELRECIGPSSLQVRVLDKNGQPAVGVPVFFYWPGGHDMREVEPKGEAGFGMGAYYRPPDGGPYWTFVESDMDSQVVWGLGMIGKSTHRHLNPTFQEIEESPPVPPPDGYKARWEQALQALKDIRERASREIP